MDAKQREQTNRWDQLLLRIYNTLSTLSETLGAALQANDQQRLERLLVNAESLLEQLAELSDYLQARFPTQQQQIKEFFQKRSNRGAGTLLGVLVALAGVVAVPVTAGASLALVPAGIGLGTHQGHDLLNANKQLQELQAQNTKDKEIYEKLLLILQGGDIITVAIRVRELLKLLYSTPN